MSAEQRQRGAPVTTEVRISGIDEVTVRVTQFGGPVTFALTADHARALARQLISQADVVTYRKPPT